MLPEPRMFKALLRFYWSLLTQEGFIPAWLDNRTPDHLHFHRRRYTTKYKQKQRIVRSLWFVVCLVLLCFPFIQLAIALALLATFLSFCILDETQ
jgi:hypothetical protein